MARSQLELQALLEALTDHVYFQPPSGHQMDYPCIRYELDSGRTKFADDAPYIFTKRYTATIIDLDPDSPLINKLAALPMCTLTRTYRADGLNHTVFNLYF